MESIPETVTVKRLLSIDEVAAYLRTPRATLYKLRSQGRGPRASRVGRELRFRLTDVDAWLDDLADLEDAAIESNVKRAAA